MHPIIQNLFSNVSCYNFLNGLRRKEKEFHVLISFQSYQNYFRKQKKTVGVPVHQQSKNACRFICFFVQLCKDLYFCSSVVHNLIE
jgi:hypothetical protein